MKSEIVTKIFGAEAGGEAAGQVEEACDNTGTGAAAAVVLNSGGEEEDAQEEEDGERGEEEEEGGGKAQAASVDLEAAAAGAAAGDDKDSKLKYLPPEFAARLENVISDHIENLEHSIRIQKSLETTYLEKLGTGESAEAWSRLQKAVSAYDAALAAGNQAAQAQAFETIRFIAGDGLGRAFLYRDIQSIQESQRKLSETLSRVRKEAQEIYTHEQWNELLSVLIQVLKSNIRDTVILQAIQRDLYERTQNTKQLAGAR